MGCIPKSNNICPKSNNLFIDNKRSKPVQHNKICNKSKPKSKDSNEITLNSRKIITIILQGGLGNILFQLASAYGLTQRYNFTLHIYIKDIGQHKTTEYTFLNNFTRTSFLHPIMIEPSEGCTLYDDELLKNCKNNISLSGFFQNEKYFDDYRESFLKKVIDVDIMNQMKLKYKFMDNAYFIHIRRGDYVGNELHHIDLKKYFMDVIKFITHNDKKYIFYVFSDDIYHCINSKIFEQIDNDKLVFVDEKNELKALYLMSLCNKGGICSNSTFGWWGGYLNENKNKILFFPEQWFNNNWKIDIYPKNGIIYNHVTEHFKLHCHDIDVEKYISSNIKMINIDNIIKKIYKEYEHDKYEWFVYLDYVWIVPNKNGLHVVLYNHKRQKLINDNEKNILIEYQINKIQSRISLNEKLYSNKRNIYIIHLKHRHDRKEEILRDNKYVNFNIFWFDAYYSQYGHLGCAMSHIALTYYAKINNMKSILVAEDDNTFNFTIEQIDDTLNLLYENFDKWILFNGMPSLWDAIIKKRNLTKYRSFHDDFIDISWAQCTNFVIYTEKMYDILLNYPIIESQNKELHIDQYIPLYINITTTIQNNKYIARQFSSISDITSGYSDYDSCIEQGKTLLLEKKTSYKYSIGIFGIFIGKYVKFYENYIQNINKMFIPSMKKIFFIVTDCNGLPTFNLDVYFLNKSHIGWPYETLYRFKYFLDFDKKILRNCNYIFFLNANAHIEQPINMYDICGNDTMTFTLHHGYINKLYDDCAFEKNKSSTAYIEYNKNRQYIAGGFFGGPTNMFIEMCNILNENIDTDEKNNHIAIWHDESHLNWYFNIYNQNDVKLLGIEYHIPEEYYNKFNNHKIIYLKKENILDGIDDKNKSGGVVLFNKK